VEKKEKCHKCEFKTEVIEAPDDGGRKIGARDVEALVTVKRFGGGVRA